MVQELRELTDGVFTLKETEVEGEFIFFRNDKEVLKNVGTNNVMVLFSKYLFEKSQKGEIQQSVYECKMRFEISTDGKIIKLTVKNKPNLQVVRIEDVTRPNFFQRIKKMFGGNG